MPIATPEVYNEMLDRAKEGAFAFPAINCTSSETDQRRAARLRRGRERRDHPVLHRRRGVRLRPVGQGHGHRRERAGRVRARRRREVLDQRRAAHRPLPEGQARRLRPPADRDQPGAGRPAARTRCSSRTCGTARRSSCTRTSRSPRSCWPRRPRPRSSSRWRSASSAARRTASPTASDDKLYTAPGDYEATVEALGGGEKGRYLLAATFGNVHGVYKPGNVEARPDVLKEGQEVATRKLGLPEGSKPFDLVFHGGSGSLLEEIHEALDYGVIKMNVDTDAQYAFTRPIAGPHVRELRRRAEDRRRGRQQEGLRPAQLPQGGREGHGRPRVVTACENLRSTGQTLGR